MSQARIATNFGFLKDHDPVFFQLASTAETVFSADPNTTLIKLRQLAEAITQHIATRIGIDFDESTSQIDLLHKLDRSIKLDPMVKQAFHTIRKEGNRATHEFRTKHKEAMDGLKLARSLSVWFHRAFGKEGRQFNPGPFVPPEDPSAQLRQLHSDVQSLQSRLKEADEELEGNKQLAELLKRERQEYAALAKQMETEAKGYEELALEHEAALNKMQAEYEKRLSELQKQVADSTAAALEIEQQTQEASKEFSLNEELTRILIDQQLINAGWEADTQELTYQKGARPQKDKNLAIAEWPTAYGQRADYILFAGLIPIAVVEAKRENTNVAGKIPQAERYSKGFSATSDMQPAWQIQGLGAAWSDGEAGYYNIPFVYSSNARPYIKQLAEQSGTWFRDARSPANISRALHDFHSPEGLLDKLKRSKTEAEEKLKQESFGYLKLRDYQEKAIRSVEAAVEAGQSNCLLAMATGTGKTRTIIGLMYRFLKAERFKRILFLVDRTALGQQAIDVFNEAPLEQNQTLAKIYNLAELGDMAVEAQTRIQVATVQAMVRRVFQSDNPPSVDEFDCIIVDEAHRGYTLDQEMTEGELQVRDQTQYLSSYRRVLEYFDSTKVGLTATPAKHTTEIFGKPVYTYSYREAVADDWLIDHEPPIRYETLLTQHGIHFEKGEEVQAINTQTGQLELAELEDEQNFEVSAFNRRVITEGFNKVICDQLAQELDPNGEEKALIFCATDLHADMVKRLLDEAFKDVWGEEYNEAAVRKITGASDKVDQLIRRYKNEKWPSIAITVDLLTTGIDVPEICHLVFMRRIRSRILFEQMLGRATRRCDDIGKTEFKIYDPVDIYATLQNVTDMKPLVKHPDIPLQQLVDELLDPKSQSAVGEDAEKAHADDVLDAINQKLMRVFRKAEKHAEKRPEVKQRLEELEQLWGIEPGKLHKHLREIGVRKACQFIQQNSTFVKQVDDMKILLGSEYKPLVYEGDDRLTNRVQEPVAGYVSGDYLEEFNKFINENINQSAALSVVVTKPKDLTREQLKEIRLLLDAHGYSEANLKTAWRNKTNQEIAASIIGYIRQAALGEALVPFEQRVQHAMQNIYAMNAWTPVQRKWLDRLAKQLTHEVVIDSHFVNKAFSGDGGAKQLDKVLGNKLDDVMQGLSEKLWAASN